MFLNPGSFSIPSLLIYALAIIWLLVGEAWLLRIARRTEDASAHWRYRKNTNPGRTFDGRMKSDKAPGYWPTRFLLAVAISATIAVLFAVLFAVWSPHSEPFMFGDGRPTLLGLPSNVVLSVVAAAGAVIGLIWTIRIFRGPRDEPPPWRYRNR